MTQIYVSSVYCKETYPDNNGMEFYNDFNQNLYLNDMWKVGLAEIQYTPNAWDNVRDGKNTIDMELFEYPVQTKALCIIKIIRYYYPHGISFILLQHLSQLLKLIMNAYIHLSCQLDARP